MKHLQSTLIAASLLIGSSAQAQSTFPDVPDNHWAAAAVKTLAEAGIIEGLPGRVESAPQIGSAAPAQSTLNADAAKKNGAASKSEAATIAPKIKAALVASAPLKNSSINVEVMNCCKSVTLEGRVQNQKQKQLATQIAKTHAPKYQIVNDLKVAPVKISQNR